MAYPSTITTFTDPTGSSLLTSPDHAVLHTDINDTLEAVQTTVGTTAGTNVLKDFAAGQFPARVNTGGTIIQALVGGTINNSIYGTPAITGGTATSTTLNANIIGTPAITGGTQTAPVIVTNSFGSAVYSGTAAGTTTIDLSTGKRHLVNMPNSAGSVTLAVSNGVANSTYIVEIKQGTAGLGTIGWFTGITWVNNTPGTVGTAVSKKDSYGFLFTSGTTADGYILGTNI